MPDKKTTPSNINLGSRQHMLTLVNNTWVKGVLENSLQRAVLTELGLEECKQAVKISREMVLWQDNGHKPLPSGTKIIDVFDEVGQNLLILGAPGSGKTFTLLELAQDLLNRAEQDPTRAFCGHEIA